MLIPWRWLFVHWSPLWKQICGFQFFWKRDKLLSIPEYFYRNLSNFNIHRNNAWNKNAPVLVGNSKSSLEWKTKGISIKLIKIIDIYTKKRCLHIFSSIVSKWESKTSPKAHIGFCGYWRSSGTCTRYLPVQSALNLYIPMLVFVLEP